MNDPTEPQVLRNQRGPLFSEETTNSAKALWQKSRRWSQISQRKKKMGGKEAENILGLERGLTFLFLAQGIRKGGKETEGNSQKD